MSGTLPKEAIQEYCRQYFALESSFPRFLSAIHSRTEDPAPRQHLLENLWDEGHGAENHRELWLRFAEGMGVAREDVEREILEGSDRDRVLDGTQRALDAWWAFLDAVDVPA